MGHLLRSGVEGSYITPIFLTENVILSIIRGFQVMQVTPPEEGMTNYNIPTRKTRLPSGTERSGLCILTATLSLLCDSTLPVDTSIFLGAFI